jgi:hypothetical protein
MKLPRDLSAADLEKALRRVFGYQFVRQLGLARFPDRVAPAAAGRGCKTEERKESSSLDKYFIRKFQGSSF